MRAIDTAIALLVVGLWGLNFVVVKVGVAEMPPVFYVCIRFVLVFLLLAPFLRWPGRRLRDVAVLSFVLGSLHFPLMFAGMLFLEAGTVSVIVQLQTVFSALLAFAFFGERLSWRGWAGMAIALGGIGLIAGGVRLDANGWAVLLPVAGAFFWAFYNALLKHFGPMDGNQLNGWLALLIAPQTLVLSLLLEQGQWRSLVGMSWGLAGSLLYQAIPMMIVSYWLWYRLIYKYPMTSVTPFMLLMPAFGLASGHLLLGEALTTVNLAGGGLTIVGVGMIVLRRRASAVRAGTS
jgi:O-acetylserine/cysteine efflux transporter